MPASTISNHIQGYRFSDESASVYDATNFRFKDQSPYGVNFPENDCIRYAGSAVFEDVGSNTRRALRIDGSSHWKFIPACPWEGTHVIAMMIQSASASFPIALQGNATTITSNSLIWSVQSGSQSLLRILINAATLNANLGSLSATNPRIIVGAYSFDQEQRKSYATIDGIAVTENTATATVNGNAIAMSGSTSTGGVGGGTAETDMPGSFFRLGDVNNSGMQSPNTTPDADFCHIMEHHSFKGNAILNELANVKTFLDELISYYGTA